MSLKADRQKAILRIISENEVGTQEELQGLLKQEGYDTTQATISRDIRELKLRKKSVDMGPQRYVAEISHKGLNQSGDSGSYKQILASGIVELATAGNLIVIKTYSGVAMAVGAAIDNMHIDGVVGCIAGDDTIFVAIHDISQAKSIMDFFRQFMNE